MAARSSDVVRFLLAALLGVVALVSMACSVILLFPLHLAIVPFLQRAQGILAFWSWATCFIFVAIFGYRPRVTWFLKNRNGFLFSPMTAMGWMIVAAELSSL